MKRYEIIDHPAELRFRVYGRNIEGLFTNAALALAETLRRGAKEMSKNPGLKTKKLELKTKSADINSLLVDFLNEVLAKSHINKAVYLASGIKYQKLKSRTCLKAELIGYPVEHFDEDIKAVTYEDLNVKLEGEIWQTSLVLDI